MSVALFRILRQDIKESNARIGVRYQAVFSHKDPAA